LFHAAGYNVPQNYIVYFHPKILRLGDNVTFTDNLGRKRLMEQQDLEQMLLRVSIRPDGRVRAIASKYLVENPDNLLGPFKYQETRSDDSNDIIPHQHRRELRGLRVMAAWLNHFDTKASNTLDVFTEEGYVKHFLIDFGSTLGSNGDELMPPEVGFENSFDVTQIFLNIFTLGLWVKAWERPYKIPYPSIGHFTSKNFHPKKYKFIIMNPAFDHMTDQDAYWGAKLVMCFTDEQIIAAVAEGQYSDPASASYLARTLIERRDIIGRYWFRSVVPLDRFRLLNSPEGAQMLAFVDLAVDTGIEKKEDLQYRYSLIDGEGNIIQKNTTIQGPLVIPLPSIKLSVQSESSRRKILRNNIWTIRIQKKHRQSSEWSDNINIYLMKDNYSQLFSLYGLKRDD